MAIRPGGLGGVKKFGNWPLADNVSARMGNAIGVSLKQSLKQISLKAEREAVIGIEKQVRAISKHPLSKKYVARKKRKGLSTKILIATSTYFQNITSTVKGNVGFAGVLKTVKNKEGENVANIGAVLEFGSIKRGIPPRRLWKFVHGKMFKFLRERRLFETNALAAIRSAGGK